MKRAMDFSLATIMLLVLSPVIVIVSIIIGLQLGLPILSKSLRPGLNGIPFYLYKFRTVNEDEEPLKPLPVSSSLGQFGRFLRYSGLERLPQLLNVLRGEMSFVGPCPCTAGDLARCSMGQVRRFHVKPGITGWAQIQEQSAYSWLEKYKLDVWYVDNKNLKLDLLILWITVRKIFNHKNMSSSGMSRHENFSGPRLKDG